MTDQELLIKLALEVATVDSVVLKDLMRQVVKCQNVDTNDGTPTEHVWKHAQQISNAAAILRDAVEELQQCAGVRPVVAVDFDGVLHSYISPWIRATAIPDPPVEGAIQWLTEVVKRYDVVIFTCRALDAEVGGVTVQNVIFSWLLEHGLDPYALRHIRVTAEKPQARVYLDDRALPFDGPQSFPSIEQLDVFVPWQKRAVLGDPMIVEGITGDLILESRVEGTKT